MMIVLEIWKTIIKKKDKCDNDSNLMASTLDNLWISRYQLSTQNKLDNNLLNFPLDSFSYFMKSILQVERQSAAAVIKERKAQLTWCPTAETLEKEAATFGSNRKV